MFSRKELKQKSLNSLKGKWSNPVVASILYIAISIAAATLLSSIVTLLVVLIGIISVQVFNSTVGVIFALVIKECLPTILSLLLLPLSLGLIIYFLTFAKNQNPKITDIFNGYKDSFGNSILLGLLVAIYTLLWSLLFIIPGIIKAYSYSMSYYVMAENPKISANEAINKSKELMNGHKWEFFLLQLSFIGWEFLSIFTCGIGYLWLFPYMSITYSNFYLAIKEKHEETAPDNQVVLEQF